MKFKPSKTIIVFALFLFLLAVYFFLKNSSTEKFSVKSRKAFTDITSDKIEKVQIHYSDKDTILEKRDGKFLVVSKEDAPADNQSVTAILADLTNLEIGELISTNKDKWSLFEVDNQAVNVKFTAAGKDYEIWIGKYGPDFQSNYLRVGKDPQTYLTGKNIRNDFTKSELRDLTIASINTLEIEGMELNYQDTSIKVKKDGSGWKSDSKDVDSEKVNSFLAKFSPLKAGNLLSSKEAKEADFKNPYLTVKLVSDNKQETEITFGGKNKDGDYFTKTSLNGSIFTLSAGNITLFPKSLKDLQK